MFERTAQCWSRVNAGLRAAWFPRSLYSIGRVVGGAAPFLQREFTFTQQDFDRVCNLIYQYAGIRLKDSKQHMVYSRLARRLRATGSASCSAYLANLEHDSSEWQNFVNALTTNLTAFFREPHHFSILADYLNQLKSTAQRRPITIWCAAVSTGEEAYSIAMTAADVFETLTPPVKILATDIDTQVLAKAEQGVFSMDLAQKLSSAALKRFFLKGQGDNDGCVKIRAQLRQTITFRELNLLAEDWKLHNQFDAIFCRNVMIYFDKPTQYRILQRFEPLLRPDGLLFAGHSENLQQAAEFFKPSGKTVYRRARCSAEESNFSRA